MIDMQALAAQMVTRQWYFYQPEPNVWRWDVVGARGEILQQCTSSFGSRAECVLDAKAHGYVGSAHPSE